MTPRRRSTGSWPPVTDDATPPPPAGTDNNSQLSVTLTFLRISLSLKLTEHASWFVANGLHVPPIAYKLRSLSDLPGLILPMAGTPMQGVLDRLRYRLLCILEYLRCVPVSSFL